MRERTSQRNDRITLPRSRWRITTQRRMSRTKMDSRRLVSIQYLPWPEVEWLNQGSEENTGSVQPRMERIAETSRTRKGLKILHGDYYMVRKSIKVQTVRVQDMDAFE